MRVVHVVRQFYPAQGGLETFVLNLAQRQVAGGDVVKVVTLDRIFDSVARLPRSEWLGGLEIRRIPFVGSRRYPIALTVLMSLRNAEIIHVHGLDFFCDFLAATKVIHRKTLVLSTHGGFFHSAFASKAKALYFKTVTRLALTRYGYVAANSMADLSTFQTIRSAGIGVVLNGVDTSKFSGVHRSSRKKRIIYFGRLADNKNVQAILPVLKKLQALDPMWSLVLAGRPMDGIVEKIRRDVEALRLVGAVEIVENPNDERLRSLVAECSIFCSPSRHEGFGIAAIEAVSAGLYPVLSDIPAHRESIAALGCGLLLDFFDPDNCASKIDATWMSDPWSDFVSRAPQMLRRYNWDAVTAVFNKIYGDVVGRDHRLIIGVQVQVCDRDLAVKTLQGALDTGSVAKVTFLNAHLANIAASDQNIANALQDFIVFNDGIGVDIASKALYGEKFPANLNGTDFIPYALDKLRSGLRLYLLGGTDQVRSRAVEHYVLRWPNHKVIGSHPGFFRESDAGVLAERVKQTRPDIILVAMGCPKQELWLQRFIPDVCSIGIGVGALFDFQTGTFPRAPPLIREMRLEWLYRLLLEPRRLAKRYLVGNIVFLYQTMRQYLRGDRA